MPFGIEDDRFAVTSKLTRIALVAVACGLYGSHAGGRMPVASQSDVAPVCAATVQGNAQADDETRGCCILVTASGPSCAFASRGYCAMRAREAGVLFEFHEVASCSELAQCR